jgi:hypothetical protein
MRPRTVAQSETYPKLGADSGRRRVPVDRPDPADDPDEPGHRRPPDDPGSPDAAPLGPPDPPDRDTILAYRALADRAHAAHRESKRDGTRDAPADADRDSWAEALPSLRASWGEHENRYPERERVTPLTHMDGSWSSGETRRLTPEQNTEATKACADIHDEGERVVFPAMRQIEAADPNRGLAGVEYMLKKTDRLKEKIADVLLLESHLSPREALDKVPDAVRGPS